MTCRPVPESTPTMRPENRPVSAARPGSPAEVSVCTSTSVVEPLNRYDGDGLRALRSRSPPIRPPAASARRSVRLRRPAPYWSLACSPSKPWPLRRPCAPVISPSRPGAPAGPITWTRPAASPAMVTAALGKNRAWTVARSSPGEVSPNCSHGPPPKTMEPSSTTGDPSATSARPGDSACMLSTVIGPVTCRSCRCSGRYSTSASWSLSTAL